MYFFSLTLFDKEPILKHEFMPWAPLAHNSVIKVPWAGLCLFLLLLLSCSQRGHSFWSNSCCPFLPPIHPTWSSRGHICTDYTYVCGEYLPLHTTSALPLNLYQVVVKGLNQRIAALHSCSDIACCFSQLF